MRFIDVHTHNKNSDNAILNVIAGKEKLDRAPDVPFSIGIHPWFIGDKYSELLSLTEKYAESPFCMAIGECGMDKLINTPEDIQREVFTEQAKLAEKLSLPLIIHCVKYYYELLKIRENKLFKSPWIFHGYNQNSQIASKIIKAGCYISFGSSLINPSQKIKKTVEKVPPENIFLETDDSGESISDIYAACADLKNIPVDAMALQIEDNIRTCFPRSYAKLLA